MALPDPEKVLADMRGTEKKEDDEKNLPAETTFSIDITSARGKQYAGTFRYRVPTLGQQIEIGRLKTAYLPQGAAADVNAASLVEIISYLSVCIHFDDTHKKPSWWNPLQTHDHEPYTELFGRCLDYEARFLGKRPERRADQGESEGVRKLPRDDSPVVGDEVQPPAKRSETLAGDGA